MCAKLTNPKLDTPLKHPQNRQYLNAVQKLVNIYVSFTLTINMDICSWNTIVNYSIIV